MDIEFDASKRTLTLENRGLDMADTEKVSSGPHITVLDDRREYGEQRLITVGYMDGRMVVMVWTPRQSAYRIISLRKANAREEKRFQPRLGG